MLPGTNPENRVADRSIAGRRRWGPLLLGAMLCWAPVAAAQPASDEMARRHFEAGTAYLEEGDYEDALREFKRAYDLSRRPELLINVATVEERLGHLDAAVTALERYLELDPGGEHAEAIAPRLERLRKRLEKERAREPAPPAAAPEPEPAAPPPAPPPAGSRPEPAVAGSSLLPAWILFGVAGASAIGAGITGAVALGEHSNAERTCSPTCTDDELATGRAMAVTSTILTGVAVASAGVGLVLVLTRSDAEGAGESVAVSVSGAPGAALARARWAF
jgi:tetratricopeptide (TPR) repeat protein